MSHELGVSTLGVLPLAGTWARAKPTATITSPTGTVTTVALSFTYSSPVGRAQYSYRFQIRSEDGTVVLYDSFTVVSTDDTDIVVDYLFSGGTTYQMWVAVADLFDTGDWATSTFTPDLVDVNDFPVNDLVGSIYEIGINGMGLMLDDGPQTPAERAVSVLQPPRFATGDTPFSEAVERYTFLGQSSFKGGAGQTYRDRPDSDPTRYLDSEGVNPFEDDALQLLPATTEIINDTYAWPMMVVASGLLFVVTANGELSSKETIAGATTTFTITGAGFPTDMASDGNYWYYADGSNVYRNNDATDPGGAWSTINVLRLAWIGDRIAATYNNGSGEIAVTTFADDGTEEVVGGRFLYPYPDNDVYSITGGDGYMWFIVGKPDSSQIHFWKIGTDDTYAAIGLTMPAGQLAASIGYYLGNLFVHAVQVHEDGGSTNFIYRCIPNDGVLTPELILEWDTDFTPSVVGSRHFSGNGRYVYFGRKEMTAAGAAGVMAIDLASGGYAKWISGGAGDVSSVAIWNGRVSYAVNSDGTYVASDTMISSGFLKTSISDQASGLTKVYDEIRATFDPLPASCGVSIEYTVDGGTSYTALSSSASTAGQSLLNEDLGQEARSVGLTISFNANGSSSPKLRHVQVKLHALSISDQLLQFPVKCHDRMVGLNGRPLPTDAPGGGISLVRTLEGLIGTRVKLQDVDWVITNTTTIWELVDVRTKLTMAFNPKENRNVISGVATITLRRSS